MFATLEGKGKGRQEKKIQQHMSTRTIEEIRKQSKDKELFGMQIITDLFRDGWHKCVTNQFVRQRIVVLFDNRWHK